MAGWKSFREIVAWQLAYKLRKQTRPLMARTLERRDFKFHDNLKDAARSATRNIAEGFGRWKHKDFAKFVRIAKSSECELLDHFHEAFDCGYLSKQEYRELEHSAKKALKAAVGLIRYLESTPDL